MTLTKDALHHAYIYEGERDTVYLHLCSFCEDELQFATKANPDFVYEVADKFLISHARRLQEMQMNKTKDGGRKIFIISFNFITREAQNALLKVLEEPTDGTHFFFITPSAHIFLDTVLSRVQLVSTFKSDTADDEGSDFLKASYSKRIAAAGKLAQNIKDEKATKADALRLVRSVIRIKHAEVLKNTNREGIVSLKEMEKLADYLYDNSASTKTILEHLALIA